MVARCHDQEKGVPQHKRLHLEASPKLPPGWQDKTPVFVVGCLVQLHPLEGGGQASTLTGAAYSILQRCGAAAAGAAVAGGAAASTQSSSTRCGHLVPRKTCCPLSGVSGTTATSTARLAAVCCDSLSCWQLCTCTAACLRFQPAAAVLCLLHANLLAVQTAKPAVL